MTGQRSVFQHSGANCRPERNLPAINRTSQSNIRHQAGVSIIETLVAVVLLSIGFLAAARMQVEGMRYSQSAYYQSQAYFLANDMIDRMRSNVKGVNAGYYSGASTRADATSPGCETIQCSALGLARQDIYDWSASLHSQDGVTDFIPALPGTVENPAKGEIQNLNNGVFAIVMTWNEVIGGEDELQQLRLQFALESL